MHTPIQTPAQAAIAASPLIRERKIRLMIFDIDGVMTDGQLYYTQSGESIKVFHVHDGHGLKMLQQNGIAVAIISGRQGAALQKRLDDLSIPTSHIFLGCGEHKIDAFEKLLNQTQLTPAQCGMMGDDAPDLPLIQRCGFSACPPQARPFILNAAQYITTAKAGRGAVREVCDLLLSPIQSYQS